MRQGIAAGSQNAIGRPVNPDRPMNAQPLLSSEQRHIPQANCLCVRSLDAEQVARPKGREHTGAHRAQRHRTMIAEDFQRKLSFHPGAGGRAVIPLP
jgi:hypothetical protein